MSRWPPLLLLVALLPGVALAHELQSVALWLEEEAPGVIALTLKTPLAKDGSAAAILPRLPADCRTAGDVRVTRESAVVIRQWRQDCATALDGMAVRVDGLDPRAPEAVIVARFAGGRELTQVVDYHAPEAVLRAPVHAAGAQVSAYVGIGIEHILLGADHLLFVLGLLLVVAAAGHGLRMLVAALTAFTVAHSLTLACTALGLWGLPPRVVEVLIALSIVVLALELAGHARRQNKWGQTPISFAQHQSDPGFRSLTLRRPWLAAFAFGLLHGFGFAGALAEVGLPEHARGWALFLFNLGVEIGQLLFVAALLATWAVLRRTLSLDTPAVAGYSGRAGFLITTALGGVAMYWALDRAAAWATVLAL